jgi:hypothetical protein
MYPGESTSAPLIQWLNSPRKSETGLIAGLMQAAEEQSAIENTAPVDVFTTLLPELNDPRKSDAAKKKFAESLRRYKKDSGKLTRAINSILDFYTFTPFVECDRGTNGRMYWTTKWRQPDWQEAKISQRELDTLMKLLELAARGLLHRVRRCEDRKCGRWFYARFENRSKFCRKDCQERCYKSNEKYLQQHRDQMKKKRINEKEAARLELELARKLAQKPLSSKRRR